MRPATRTSSRWSPQPSPRGSTPSPALISSCSNNTTKDSSAFRPVWRARSRRPFSQGTTSGQKTRRCGTGTCLAKAITTLSCRTTAWKRTPSFCPSSSSWRGRRASPWLPPTTPTICAGKTPKCRASFSASRPARPCRMPIRWSSRPMSFTSRRRMKCTICSPWCRRPAKTPRRSRTSVTLILTSATPRSPTTKRPTGWTIRLFLKSSAGRVWSAATAPMSRRPTKTA